jgi:hypothetical protein
MVCHVCGHPNISAPYRSETVIYLACDRCGSVWATDTSLLATHTVAKPPGKHRTTERRLRERRQHIR